MTAPQVLGLDIGGSKTHALAVSGDTVTGECVSGSANISSVGQEQAEAALDELVSRLPSAHVEAVCAGAAGADSVDGRARLVRLLTDRFPGSRVAVVHDTRIILAAAGLETGSVVISGTGSAAWARRADGQEARAGGWGYLLGDEGSGYAITRETVRVALTEVDEGRRPSPLSRRLLAACGLDHSWQLLDRFYTHPQRKYWAEFSRVVFDLAAAGDPVSEAIVESAAEALVSLAVRVNSRVGLRGPVVLAGGLVTNQPRLSARVTALLSEQSLSDVRVLDRDPVWGAVGLARELAGTVGSHSLHPQEIS